MGSPSDRAARPGLSSGRDEESDENRGEENQRERTDAPHVRPPIEEPRR
jgi:hypothetical protein